MILSIILVGIAVDSIYSVRSIYYLRHCWAWREMPTLHFLAFAQTNWSHKSIFNFLILGYSSVTFNSLRPYFPASCDSDHMMSLKCGNKYPPHSYRSALIWHGLTPETSIKMLMCQSNFNWEGWLITYSSWFLLNHTCSYICGHSNVYVIC